MNSPSQSGPRANPCTLERIALFGFIVTFMAARALVFLIMSKQVQNMYFFVKGTHVHHLNYGIFLLAVVAGFSVFRRPVGRTAEWVALLYGISMGLTFDEFGMWLHLGGSYWQQTSVTAVVILSALLALLAYSRKIERFESHHKKAGVALFLILAGFSWVLWTAGSHFGELIAPRLQELERSSSP